MALPRAVVLRSICAALVALLLSPAFAQTAGSAPALPPSSAEDTQSPSQPVVVPVSPAPGGPPVATIRTFVPEVPLVFTVTDGKGRFVTGLKQQDFGLLDDGKRPDRVISFTQQANLPLRIGILLDTSNSIRSNSSSRRPRNSSCKCCGPSSTRRLSRGLMYVSISRRTTPTALTSSAQQREAASRWRHRLLRRGIPDLPRPDADRALH